MNESEPAQPALPLRVGDLLSAERRKQGLKLDAIAERTRVPLRHLKSLEDSDHESLPATTYSAGFVKAYARLLGLDADALTAEFRAERGEGGRVSRPVATTFEPADPKRVPPRLLATVAVATALLFGLAWLVWRGVGDGDARQQLAAGLSSPAPEATADPAPRPVPPQPAPPAVRPISDADPVVLAPTVEEVWLKITDTGGKILWMGTLKPGDTYQVPADAIDPRLQTGRPQSLSATVGARKLDALDRELRTVRGVPLKGAQLVAYVETIDRSAAGKGAAPNSDVATVARP